MYFYSTIFFFLTFRAHNKIDKLDSVALKNLPNLRFLDMNKNKLVLLEADSFPQYNHLRILLV